MKFQNFEVPALKELYAKPYDSKMIEWRRLGAQDKSANLERMLCECDAMKDLKSVLEVGCGTGAVLKMVSEKIKANNYTGIEIGEERSVKSLEAGDDSRVEIHGYDGKAIPYPDNHFDLVYATHVLEHVVDQRSFIHELRRVSRKYVYIEVPCELHLRTNARALQETLTIGHINAYTPESFALTLQTSGLRIELLKVMDQAFAVKAFKKAKWKAVIAHLARQILLSISETFAARLFAYHVGALCITSAKLDIVSKDS